MIFGLDALISTEFFLGDDDILWKWTVCFLLLAIQILAMVDARPFFGFFYKGKTGRYTVVSSRIPSSCSSIWQYSSILTAMCQGGTVDYYSFEWYVLSTFCQRFVKRFVIQCTVSLPIWTFSERGGPYDNNTGRTFISKLHASKNRPEFIYGPDDIPYLLYSWFQR